jgi:hypothetical protein
MTIDNCVEPTAAEAALTDNLAKQKLLDDIKGQKVNLAQVFAERRQTVDMIGSTAVRIGQAMMQLRRGDIRSAARMLKTTVSRGKAANFNQLYAREGWRNALSSGWLELQYGWKPLLDDIEGAANWLASKQSEEMKESAHATKRKFYQVTTKQRVHPGDYYIDTEYTYLVRYGCEFTTSGVALADVKEAGILNVATIAWELTPWSFVVDWFIPIGNYINTLDATIGLGWKRGYTTTHLNSFIGYNCYVNGAWAGGRIYKGYAISSRRKVRTVRTVLSGFPQMSFPSFKNPFSFAHSLNAIALLTQVFVKKKA